MGFVSRCLNGEEIVASVSEVCFDSFLCVEMPKIRSTSSRGWLERYGAVIVQTGMIVSTVGTSVAIGGVHRPVIWGSTLVLSLMALVLVRMRAVRGGEIAIPWFATVLFGMTLYTLLQTLPLPYSVLQMIAPTSAELLKVSLSRVPMWHSISLEPIQTLWETLKIGACALTFLVAHNLYHRRERRYKLMLAIVIAGVLVTILGLIGAAVAPSRPLMLYKPEAPRYAVLFVTSFVNSNHGAAFLMICTLCACGLVFERLELQSRVLLGLAALLCGGGVILTLSKGGIVSLAVALLLLGVTMALRARQEEGASRRITALFPLLMGVLMAVVAWIAYEPIAIQLSRGNEVETAALAKMGLWSPGLKMLSQHLWVGVGRGAFMTTFPRYLEGSLGADRTFSHLENQYLHLPIEWGVIPAAFVIISSTVFVLLLLWRVRQKPTLAASACALVGLGVHAIADFNLETLGIALLASVLLGTLSGKAARKSRGTSASSSHVSVDELGRRDWKKIAVPALIYGTFAVLFMTMIAWRHDPDDDAQKIGRLIGENARPDVVKKAIETARTRHPADYLPQLLAGQWLSDRRDPEAMQWLNRAMYLSPSNALIHLEAARMLRRLGRRHQALLEYRIALEHGANPNPALQIVLVLSKNIDELKRFIPHNERLMALAIDGLVARKRNEEALALVPLVEESWPQSTVMTHSIVKLLIATNRADAALKHIERLLSTTETPELFHLWRDAIEKTGRIDDEIRVIRRAIDRYPNEMAFRFLLAEAYLRGDKLTEAERIALKLKEDANNSQELSRSHELMAKILRKQGKGHRAEWEEEAAAKIK